MMYTILRAYYGNADQFNYHYGLFQTTVSFISLELGMGGHWNVVCVVSSGVYRVHIFVCICLRSNLFF